MSWLAMPKRLLVYSRTQPARMIVGVVALFTFLAGIWVICPWYLPLALPAASKAIGVSVTIAGICNALVSLPGLYAFKKNCPKAIARGAFYMFLWYTFVALTRMIFGGVPALGWVAVLIIALIMAIVYIEQRYVASTTSAHESDE